MPSTSDTALEEQIRKEFDRKEHNLRNARKRTDDWVQPLDEGDGVSYLESSSDSDEDIDPQDFNVYQRPRRKLQGRPLLKAYNDRDKETANKVKQKDKEKEKEKPLEYRREGTLLQTKAVEQPIRWKRRNSLGKGTFGEVILGMNLGTHKLMAVKEIDFSTAPNPTQAVSPPPSLSSSSPPLSSSSSLSLHSLPKYARWTLW